MLRFSEIEAIFSHNIFLIIYLVHATNYNAWTACVILSTAVSLILIFEYCRFLFLISVSGIIVVYSIYFINFVCIFILWKMNPDEISDGHNLRLDKISRKNLRRTNFLDKTPTSKFLQYELWITLLKWVSENGNTWLIPINFYHRYLFIFLLHLKIIPNWTQKCKIRSFSQFRL